MELNKSYILKTTKNLFYLSFGFGHYIKIDKKITALKAVLVPGAGIEPARPV
jgi:hypothetical protein